jgi:type I restriction enzyme, S subunit
MSTQAKTPDANTGDELPAGWRMSTIGELLKVRNGFAFKSTEYQEEGALLIRQSNLDGSRVTIEKAKYLPKSYLDEYRDFLIKKGDILIGMSGSIGKLCTYDRDEPALQNQRTGLLVFKDPEQKPWVWHYLPLLEKDLVKVGKGVAVQNVSASQIESFPIPVAPLDQQKRIVAEIEKQFSRLDEAVANLKRVKANLKRYKAAVLKAAVEGCLVETEAEIARREGRNYETGEQLLKRILETRRSQWKGKGTYKEPAAPDTTGLPELPQGWAWVSWEMILAPDIGSFRRGPFGSTLKKTIFVETGHKVYEQYNAINDDPSFGRYYITDEKYKTMDAFSIKARDFLISCSGTIGRITQVPENYETGVINQALLRVRTDKSVISDNYFLMLFRSPYFQQQILDNVQGGAMVNVKGVADLKAIPIPLPPGEDQIHINLEVDRRFSLIREIEAQVDANLQRAKQLRQVILGTAFMGQRQA